MPNQKFILRNEGIRRNCVELIHGLPLDGTPFEITIKKYRKPRSDNQHGYYRVLLGIVSEHTGYDTDELHDFFRTKAGLWKHVHGVEVLKSTKEMSTVEMIELIETTLRVAAQDLDLTLPAPKDVAA